MPRKSGKFERCVGKVRRRGDVESPEAVCAANLRRAGWRPGRRKANPAAEAAALSEAFHGRPVGEVVELEETLREHAHLAGLGTLDLIELEDGTTLEDFEGALLASNEEGTQLFIAGGDQRVSLRRFPDVDESKELINLGPVRRIVYTTDKQHLGRADKKRGPYEHELGEESGRLPDLIYDAVNERLSFAGGAYSISAGDYDGRHSAGIRD